MSQNNKTQWPMTNIYNPWPVYTNGSRYVIAVKIDRVVPQFDGAAILIPEGEYDQVYESSDFVSVFRPLAGGYLVRDSGNQDLYIEGDKFEAEYKRTGSGETGPKGDPGVGITKITVESTPFYDFPS